MDDVLIVHDTFDLYSYRTASWEETIPQADAWTWHCKYHISAARTAEFEADYDGRGWTFLDLEAYAFDEEVLVIIQPHGEYADYLKSYP